MPNWCSGFVRVKGKPKDIKKFCELFIFQEEEGNKKDKQYFARSFIYTSWKSFEKEELKDLNEVSFIVDFAWSGYSCLIEGYPQNIKECITLSEACEKYNVEVFINTEEQGMGFEEEINFKDGKLNYECEDMPLFECQKCKEKMSFPTDTDLTEQECYDCEEYGKFKPII